MLHLGFNGFFIMIPLLPWSLAATLGEVSQILFIGYLPVYVLNASLVYALTGKNKPKNNLNMAAIVSLSTIPWTSIVFYEAATCTEKLCGLTALVAAIPGLYAANLIVGEKAAFDVPGYILAIILNVVAYFLIVWGLAALITKIKSKRRAKRHG